MDTDEPLGERVKHIEATLAQTVLPDTPSYLTTLHRESQAIHTEIVTDVEALQASLETLLDTIDAPEATSTAVTPTGTDDTPADATRRLAAKLDRLETEIADLHDRLDDHHGSYPEN